MRKNLFVCLCLAVSILAACQPAGTPVAGGTYNISLPVNKDQASAAWLTLTVSSDGGFISSVRFYAQDVNCELLRAETVDYFHVVQIPIRDGAFSFEESGVGKVEGRFDADGGASGEAAIHFTYERSGALTNFTILDREATCDLGTIQWSAEAP
ncbi:MAG: hypothetical protein AB1750_04660 [Chloroflexota bacterium]